MEINRKILVAGLLAESSFLGLSFPRKILCAYDINNTRISYDVINEETEFPIHRPRKQNGFYVTHTIFLDEILESLGYPEVLEDVHIDRIMNEDFEKVFIDTGVLRSLFTTAQEQLLPRYMDNDYHGLKDQFKLSRTEIEKKEKEKEKQKHNAKRSWFY